MFLLAGVAFGMCGVLDKVKVAASHLYRHCSMPRHLQPSRPSSGETLGHGVARPAPSSPLFVAAPPSPPSPLPRASVRPPHSPWPLVVVSPPSPSPRPLALSWWRRSVAAWASWCLAMVCLWLELAAAALTLAQALINDVRPRALSIRL